MTFGRASAFVAASLAAAAAIAHPLDLAPAIPMALALLAAVAAAASGVLAAAQAREPASPPPAPAVVAPPPARPERELEDLKAAFASERESVRAMGASALRRLRFSDSVLAKVPVKTEEAAFALMERLVSLRDQSAKASSAARDAESGAGDSVLIDTLALHARETMTRVRSALAEMRKHDRDATKGLQALGGELKSGIQLLVGIEEITERSRLIAFNMAIEAARIGEKGRGFRVIVGELRALNDRTADFSKQVAQLLGRFKQYNESLVQSAIESSMQVAEEVERGIGEEEQAIESLLRTSGSCVDLSDSVTAAVRSMNLELDGVLESLQFQDITRQMVEGALTTIAEAERDIAPVSGPAGPEEEGRLVEELRARLLARAKTKGEKEAIQEVKK